MDVKKVQTILTWPAPANLTGLSPCSGAADDS